VTGVALANELEQAAAAAAAHGQVSGVLAAEPSPGRRVYLDAFGVDEVEWLALDADGTPIEQRDRVREAASIVAMCEVAADVAGGGDLDELRSQLTRLRFVEQPPGIEEAEEAALRLERAVGAPPRLATPGYLDAVGAATMELERALGESRSPFADALRAARSPVEEFVQDVERRYKLDLR
jgi:hypothetical protein